MCGIVGYAGARPARPLLLEALLKLEYRGYDSCGIAVAGDDLVIYKDAVRITEFASSAMPAAGTIGIGHTRWASCGAPTRENAHPHADCSGLIAVVHNGNVLNYSTLKLRLEKLGHIFRSETDSEVISHLIEQYYDGDLAAAVERSMEDIEGSCALAAIHRDEKRLVAVCRGNALIIGLGDNENWLGSDVLAFLEHTNRAIYLENGDLAVISAKSVEVHRDKQLITPQIKIIDWSPEQAGKSGYEHFMLKEIHEQPRVIRENIGFGHTNKKSRANLILGQAGISSILILGCGSSYHAGLVAKGFIEELLGIPVNVELASEFSHDIAVCQANRLVIGLTQSGETADTLSAITRLKKAGSKVIALTNVAGSSITRIAEETLFLKAGPEISVAATKSFTAQLVAMLILTLIPDRLGRRLYERLTTELKSLPAKVQQVLDASASIEENARWLAKYNDVICIGRGLQYPIALETALKLKEVAYIHAEGCAAGELKHGSLALLTEATPVIAILGQDESHEAMITAIREIKVRGAPVIAVTPNADSILESLADRIIAVPATDKLLQPVVNAVALQLLAYFTARELGHSIDMPRNLAKSVTVG
ncbi:glucosamine--fructose-6-phosphate aminotransferase [Dehalogenimonas sp. WBC-2]|nr:glucosamine--fructose-6-phosphate aminotransferase [Dehalogenimonas sp. WBC-2]